MANWYSEIEIKIKNNKKISNIVSWLQSEYALDDELVNTDEKNNKLTIEGSIENTLSLKDVCEIPSCEELFTKLSKKFSDNEYDAYVSLENSYSLTTNEYFIKYYDKNLIIEALDICSRIDLDEFDDYEEFNDDYSCNLSKKEFENYKENEEILYINESGKIYTEEQYYNSKKMYFSLNIDDTLCENKNDIINKINESTIDTIFNSLNKSQKDDRDIILTVIKTDASYINKIDDKFFKDKEFVYIILKECSWLWEDLILHNKNIKDDKILVSIYENLQQISDNEQEEYDEIFQLKLPKEQANQKLENIEKKYKEKYDECIKKIEKSDDFIKWISENNII